MQKYVLICLLEKIEDGTEFPMSNWPLHVTLASNFVVDWESTGLLEKLQMFLANHRPITVTAGDDEYFGPQQQVHVTVLNMNDELKALHNGIIALLRSAGATFDEPHYLEEGYRAHATVQSETNRLHKGDQVTINTLSIVDMFSHGDIKQRKILKTIKL